MESRRIELRWSEVRQELATLAANDAPGETGIRRMGELDTEYRTLEVRFRAALVAEDTERREAGADLETREGRARDDLVGAFEVHQIVASLDHGHRLTGQTAEVVNELRSQGQYQGLPMPLEALETRATVSGDLVDPKATRGIFDRLFPPAWRRAWA